MSDVNYRHSRQRVMISEHLISAYGPFVDNLLFHETHTHTHTHVIEHTIILVNDNEA